MAEGLTQDEIDALMNLGLGSIAQEEEEDEAPPPPAASRQPAFDPFSQRAPQQPSPGPTPTA